MEHKNGQTFQVMKQLYHKDGRPYTKADYQARAEKQHAQQVFLWVSVFDFVVIFLLCGLSRYAYFLVFFDFRNSSYLSFSFFTAVLDAVLIFAIFRLTMRHMRSVLLFLTGAFILPFLVFLWQRFDIVMYQQTIVKGGRLLYKDGFPTIAGLVHDFTLYPYFVFIIIAVIAFIFDPYKEKAVKDMR